MTWQIPKPDECESPNLWKGCVALWVPALGPTGGTLRDLSGYGKHGTLKNMDPATDWVAGQIGWSLDFDGVSDYIAVPSLAITDTEAPWTLSWWSNYTGGSNDSVVCGANSFNILFRTVGNNYVAVWGTSATNQYFTNCVVAGTWQCWSLTRLGSTIELWRDGLSRGTKTYTAPETIRLSDLTQISRNHTTVAWVGQIGAMVAHMRQLVPSEIMAIAKRPPVSCGGMLTRRRRIFAASVAAPPATNRRRRLLLGSCA